MGPEDSEVNLMYILTKASRRCTSLFAIFTTNGVKYQEQKIAQQEKLQKKSKK